MKAPFPSFVPEWHNASYPAIDPTLPAHSHAGQTVIITGAGTGIGKATALAYAAAAAERVVLIGRREAKLAQTKTLIAERAPTVKVETYSASVTQIADLKGVADRVGGWDVMVLNAASLTAPKTIEESDPNDWWETIEINVLGTFAMMHAFLPSRKPGTHIVGVSSGVINMQAAHPIPAGASAYASSKLAQVRLLEHVAAECPDVFVVSVHPGIIITDLQAESRKGAGEIPSGPDGPPIDHPDLPAHFFVWATTKEAAFLRGKYCFANWDVEQLKERAQEIQETQIFTSNITGFASM